MPKKKRRSAKSQRYSSQIKKKSCSCELKTPAQLGTALTLFLITNYLLAFFISQFFPKNLVFGTHLLHPFTALVYSMTVFTLLIGLLMFKIHWLKDKMKIELTALNCKIMHLIFNIAGLWLVARLASILGMGISSWKVAVVVGVIFYLMQSLIIKSLKKA